MKITPQQMPYRMSPANLNATPAFAPQVPKAGAVQTIAQIESTRLGAEERLRQAIEQKQEIAQQAVMDDLHRAPEIGKLLDLRA